MRKILLPIFLSLTALTVFLLWSGFSHIIFSEHIIEKSEKIVEADDGNTFKIVYVETNRFPDGDTNIDMYRTRDGKTSKEGINLYFRRGRRYRF